MAAGDKDEYDGMLVEEPNDKVKYKYGTSWITGERIAVFGLILLGIILVIIGIVLLVLSRASKCAADGNVHVNTTNAPTRQLAKRCEYSAEANSIGLAEFIDKVKETYYSHHPYNIPYHPDVDVLTLKSIERVKREYVAYDPMPSVIKKRTDISYALLREINDKDINKDALTPRERKAVAQIKHYLQHVFGQPYDVNYYAGDWMMGPNLFCWQPICYHGYDIYNGIGLYHKPFNASDVKLIQAKLQSHKAGILQYIENMKMGVRKGMVRSVEECVAGTDAIKRKYLNISLYNETGNPFTVNLIYFKTPNLARMAPSITWILTLVREASLHSFVYRRKELSLRFLLISRYHFTVTSFIRLYNNITP